MNLPLGPQNDSTLFAVDVDISGVDEDREDDSSCLVPPPGDEVGIKGRNCCDAAEDVWINDDCSNDVVEMAGEIPACGKYACNGAAEDVVIGDDGTNKPVGIDDEILACGKISCSVPLPKRLARISDCEGTC